MIGHGLLGFGPHSADQVAAQDGRRFLFLRAHGHWMGASVIPLTVTSRPRYLQGSLSPRAALGRHVRAVEKLESLGVDHGWALIGA